MRNCRTPAVVVLVLVSLTGAACGSETKSQATPEAKPAPAPAASSAAGSEVTVPSTAPCVFTGTVESKKANQGTPPLLLTDVRVGTHGCFDRVVFELRPRAGQPDVPPAYVVEYRAGPIKEDPSDKPVPVKGTAFLVVRLDAMGYDLTKTDAPATYTGPPVIEAADTPRVQQVRRAGDFEGVATWVIGLDAKRPFTVTTDQSPTRLIVDVGDG